MELVLGRDKNKRVLHCEAWLLYPAGIEDRGLGFDVMKIVDHKEPVAVCFNTGKSLLVRIPDNPEDEQLDYKFKSSDGESESAKEKIGQVIDHVNTNFYSELLQCHVLSDRFHHIYGSKTQIQKFLSKHHPNSPLNLKDF